MKKKNLLIILSCIIVICTLVIIKIIFLSFENKVKTPVQVSIVTVEDKGVLSNMTEEACMEIFTKMGYQVPEELGGAALGGKNLKKKMIQLEEDMNIEGAYGSTVLTDFHNDVQSCVRRYYGVKLTDLEWNQFIRIVVKETGRKFSISELTESDKNELMNLVEEMEENIALSYKRKWADLVSEEVFEKIRHNVKRYYGMLNSDSE